MQPDNIDDLIEEFGVDEVMTPAMFHRERARLEKQFLIPYGVHTAAEIDRMIRSGEIQESDLVQDWIELHALEPYVFSKARRRPPDKKRSDDSGQEGRESGLFAFRQGVLDVYAMAQLVVGLAIGWASHRAKLASDCALVQAFRAQGFAVVPRFVQKHSSTPRHLRQQAGHARVVVGR